MAVGVDRLGGIAVSPAIHRMLAGMDKWTPTLADIPTGDTRPVKKLPAGPTGGKLYPRHGPGSREKEKKYLAQRRLRGLGDALLGSGDLVNMAINAGLADINLLIGGLGGKRDVELSMPSQDAANFLTDITGTKIVPDEEVSPEIRREGANQRALMGLIPTGAEDVIPSGAAVQGILHGVPNLFKKPALEDLAKGVDPDKVWHDWQWEMNAAGQPWTETTGKPVLRTDLEEQQSGFLPQKTSDFEAQPVDPNQLPLFTEEDLDLGGRRTTGGRFPAHYEYEPYSIPGPRVPEKHGRPKATVSSFVENPQLYEQPGLEFLGGLPMNLQKGAFSTEPNAKGLYYRPDPGTPATPKGRIAVTTQGGATLPVVQHELTHAAAQEFGLPQGFNPRHGEAASHGLRQRSIIDANKQAYDEAWQMQTDAYHRASDELYDRTGETLRLGDFKRQWAKENPMLQKIIDENAYLADFEGMSEPSLAYHTSMGEVSARNSALRDTGWYKPRQLREKRPGRTEDVPRHLQWTEDEATGDIINPSASVEDPLKPRQVGGLGSVRSKASNTEIPVSSKVDPVAPQGLGIRAYHGSPHSFEEFDISKIGTGEGAQAYGHGLYFAENEGVAKSYRDTLAGKQKWNEIGFSVDELLPMMGANTPELQSVMRPYVTRDLDRMIDFLDEEGGGIEAARTIVAKKGYASGTGTVTYPQEMQEAIAQKLAAAHAAKQGHMYEVDIAADPEAFLDWDKPLSEHPKHVQDTIIAAAHATEPTGPLAKAINQNLRSGNLALGIDQAITGLGGTGGLGQKAATEALVGKGIPGIRYLDEGSRNSTLAPGWNLKRNGQTIQTIMNKEGAEKKLAEAQRLVPDMEWRLEQEADKRSRNYVVFDPKIISIVKKYGLAAAIASGVISEEMGRQMQAQGEI